MIYLKKGDLIPFDKFWKGKGRLEKKKEEEQEEKVRKKEINQKGRKRS